MKLPDTPLHIVSLLALSLLAARADDDSPSPRHEAFIASLRETDKSELVAVEAKSASKPRSLSPVVSRFKGWFIDVTEKTKASKLGDVDAAEGISLASKSADSSYWQFIETEKGHLVVATGGKYKGWVIARDDSAETRPEGSTLTVTPALRLAAKPTDNCHWKLTLTEKGLVLKAASGKIQRLGPGTSAAATPRTPRVTARSRSTCCSPNASSRVRTSRCARRSSFAGVGTVGSHGDATSCGKLALVEVGDEIVGASPTRL